MPASLLEILRSIPDHRRAEGKRFDLATVLLYSILGMVAGANSYRQMHEFIRIHLQRLNGAFGLRLPYSPSYTGLRLIIQGLSSDAKCNTPADLISARLFRTLRSVAMRFYAHPSGDERDQIAILRAAGRSMGAIARALGRATTTISRELQRNALPSGGYSPLHAAGAYQLRRRREAILERETDLRIFVCDRLAERWTQISGWLKSGNEPRLRALT